MRGILAEMGFDEYPGLKEARRRYKAEGHDFIALADHVNVI